MTQAGVTGQDKYWPLKRYLEVHDRSLRDPGGFWDEEARTLP
jgi:hypothetical protein